MPWKARLRQDAGAPWRKVICHGKRFQLDGDLAPLVELATCRKYNAAMILMKLITGCMAPAGHGLAAARASLSKVLAIHSYLREGAGLRWCVCLRPQWC